MWTVAVDGRRPNYLEPLGPNSCLYGYRTGRRRRPSWWAQRVGVRGGPRQSEPEELWWATCRHGTPTTGLVGAGLDEVSGEPRPAAKEQLGVGAVWNDEYHGATVTSTRRVEVKLLATVTGAPSETLAGPAATPAPEEARSRRQPPVSASGCRAGP